MPRPWAETLDRRVQRAAAAAEARRRDLRERYPNVPAQAFSNMGDGLNGAGLRALRAWMRSLDTLAQTLSEKCGKTTP